MPKKIKVHVSFPDEDLKKIIQMLRFPMIRKEKTRVQVLHELRNSEAVRTNICNELNCDRRTVDKVRADYLDRGLFFLADMTPKQKEISDLLDEGLNYSQAAKELGCSKQWTHEASKFIAKKKILLSFLNDEIKASQAKELLEEI